MYNNNNNNIATQNKNFGQFVRCAVIELSYASCRRGNRYGVANRYIFGMSVLKKFQGMK
jgi:hypothetical protein